MVGWAVLWVDLLRLAEPPQLERIGHGQTGRSLRMHSTSIASCGPPRREASARTALRAATAIPHPPTSLSVSVVCSGVGPKAETQNRVEAASKTPGVPASGYRYYTSGVLGGIGHYGYSWSSTTNRTVSGIYGRFLWFNSQGLDPSDANDRATGRQLRCLSE